MTSMVVCHAPPSSFEINRKTAFPLYILYGEKPSDSPQPQLLDRFLNYFHMKFYDPIHQWSPALTTPVSTYIPNGIYRTSFIIEKMAPNSTVVEEPVPQKESVKPEYKTKIVWFNVMLFVYLHTSFLYAVYLGLTVAFWKTVLFAYIYGNLGGLGITAGSHRLWSHRSYKAKWPLRALLCCFASIAAQNDIYEWCRDHRVHHKFTETDADPHNIKRGFFFAHMGWLMCKKHPDVAKKGKT
ncbi:Acyl-CoA Delta(11) desaturase, partial [Araneus ventricosus]